MNTPQNRECRMHYNVKYLKAEPTDYSDWDKAKEKFARKGRYEH